MAERRESGRGGSGDPAHNEPPPVLPKLADDRNEPEKTGWSPTEWRRSR